jgi:hypothetical protein
MSTTTTRDPTDIPELLIEVTLKHLTANSGDDFNGLKNLPELRKRI